MEFDLKGRTLEWSWHQLEHPTLVGKCFCLLCYSWKGANKQWMVTILTVIKKSATCKASSRDFDNKLNISFLIPSSSAKVPHTCFTFCIKLFYIVTHSIGCPLTPRTLWLAAGPQDQTPDPLIRSDPPHHWAKLPQPSIKIWLMLEEDTVMSQRVFKMVSPAVIDMFKNVIQFKVLQF